MLGGEHSIVACVVYHDPDDADPERRFKAVIETKDRPRLFGVLFSGDGLRWREFDVGPQTPQCEPAGGIRFNGCYYLSAHGGSHFGAPRQLVTYLSYDFEHWIEASCLGLRRDDIPPRPYRQTFAGGEQVHLGAALWNRGNVIIGLYGQWHGPANNDRRHVEMDLGLVVSNDGLHYSEPIPDFPMVAAAEDGMNHLPRPWNFKHAALAQGQGFENIGDETLYWYAPWPEQLSDGVRVATWQRDRLGYLQPFDQRQLQVANGCHAISAPIDLGGRPAQVFLNVDGLSEYAQVTVEVLDEQFRPVAGIHPASACRWSRGSGSRSPGAAANCWTERVGRSVSGSTTRESAPRTRGSTPSTWNPPGATQRAEWRCLRGRRAGDRVSSAGLQWTRLPLTRTFPTAKPTSGASA